ncbi:MAG: NAD(P)H-dependent oxidoreductase subunit E [Halanaerobiales bacterium]
MKKISVKICVGTPCHLMGSAQLQELVENLPENVKNKFDFALVNCIDENCENAPVVKIGEKIIGNVDRERFKEELQNYL